MTQVDIHLVLVDGSPLANTRVQILLPKAGTDTSGTEIALPRKIEVNTDAEGKASVDLYPVTQAPYTLIAIDWESKAKIREEFYVPESATPVALRDLVMLTPPTNLPYDEAAIQQITQIKTDVSQTEVYHDEVLDARDATLASEARTAESEARTATSEANAKASELAVADSRSAALASQNAAASSETKAAASEAAAQVSEDAAEASAIDANNSSVKARQWATSTALVDTTYYGARKYALDGAASASAASTSENAAAASEAAAQASEVAAKASETAAQISEDNAQASEIVAASSATAAKASEDAAALSESNAANSESAADASATDAAASKTAAASSKTAAANSASAASTSETNAAASKSAAAASASAASISETNAKASETAAAGSASAAATSESNAAGSATDAEYWAAQAEQTVTKGAFDDTVVGNKGWTSTKIDAELTALEATAAAYTDDALVLYAKESDLSAVGTSGLFADLLSKPTTATRWPAWSEVTNKPGAFTPAAHNHPWTEITGKPTTYPAEAHNHDGRYYTQAQVDTMFDGLTTTPDWTDILNKPATSTRWPAWGEVTGKPSTFPPATHNHDSDYLGINAKAADADKLDGQHASAFAAASHGHSVSDITGLSDAATTSVASIRSGTTKANVGLGSVRNVSSYSQSEIDSSISTGRYDLAVTATTATLNLATRQVFTVNASTTARTLSFSNAPGSGRTMVAVIDITGSKVITWPAGINWSGGSAPELNTTWTEVTLLWNGSTWRGFKSGGAD